MCSSQRTDLNIICPRSIGCAQRPRYFRHYGLDDLVLVQEMDLRKQGSAVFLSARD